VVYASEFEDPKFGTKVLPGDEKNNAGGGPCRKVAAMLKYFDQNAEINGYSEYYVSRLMLSNTFMQLTNSNNS
jgi:hypothetical protein